ncbi:MAG TPA: NAD(P)/FAD-dependent oxidoreductase [Thermoanaerobaculia bacterium]|jgi:kynurenine 3-monooxygenase|nr:NAD(P)/FAD-dependent oxidoreductase [Thermoanaerobaculia bacterium]
MSSATGRRVSVVGAGLGGAMMGIYLARRGFAVDVFERRPDLRTLDVPGPSMNLGLSRRGIESLGRVGLAETVLAMGIPMAGRIIHDLDGRTTFQPYGRNGDQVIHALQRNDINRALLEALGACGNVRLHFETRCSGFDRDTGTARFLDDAGRETAATADAWVGADGLHSTIRQTMQRGLRADYQQEYLDWGWKELRIPSGPGGTFPLEKNAFHLWPRGGSLLFAHPNRDGSFTCSLVLPFHGAVSLESLADGEQVRDFFTRTYPDLVPLVPDLAEQFLKNPIVPLVSIRTSPWSYRDRVVLLGDAAHAVVPFYAQGMNAAFEDCALLDRCLEAHPGNRGAAFQEYERNRKRHTDALAEMSKQNFLVLRDRVRSPLQRARHTLDTALSRVVGDLWAPLHARVTNTSIPYADALELERRQDRIVKWAGIALGAGVGIALLRVLSGRNR